MQRIFKKLGKNIFHVYKRTDRCTMRTFSSSSSSRCCSSIFETRIDFFFFFVLKKNKQNSSFNWNKIWFYLIIPQSMHCNVQLSSMAEPQRAGFISSTSLGYFHWHRTFNFCLLFNINIDYIHSTILFDLGEWENDTSMYSFLFYWNL